MCNLSNVHWYQNSNEHFTGTITSYFTRFFFTPDHQRLYTQPLAVSLPLFTKSHFVSKVFRPSERETAKISLFTLAQKFNVPPRE